MQRDIDDPLRNSFHAALTVRFANEACAIESWSDGAAALFGRSAADVTGRPLAFALGAEAACERALRDGAVDLPTIECRTAAGEVVTVDLHAEPLGAGTLLLVRDPRALDGLRGVVREECRGKMIAMTARLAHEVRNPLSSVLLNLALLREVLHPSPGSDAIDSDEVLAAAESQIARIQFVVQQYVEAMRHADTPEAVFGDLAEYSA